MRTAAALSAKAAISSGATLQMQSKPPIFNATTDHSTTSSNKPSYHTPTKPLGNGIQGYEKAIFQEDGTTLTSSPTETKARWLRYAHSLFSSEITLPVFRRLIYHPDTDTFSDGPEIPLEDLLPAPRPGGPLVKYDRHFTSAEQEAARKKGHNDTATGPDDIPNEVYKLAIGKQASAFLLENLNRASF